MFNNTATVPLVANMDGNNAFGGDGLWGLIIILALLGGFGNGGFGFGGGGRNCATPEDLTAQGIVQKLDGITYGITDSTYALNNSITNGFHGVDNAICNLGYNMQTGFNGLAAQLAQCCCDNRAAISEVRYDMATQACATRQAITDGTKAVIDFLVNDKLCTLQNENSALKLQASQLAQSNYIVNTLRPAPIPAYVVPNPFEPTTTA